MEKVFQKLSNKIWLVRRLNKNVTVKQKNRFTKAHITVKKFWMSAEKLIGLKKLKERQQELPRSRNTI